MLEIYERLDSEHSIPIDDYLELSHEQRDRSRLRVISRSGREVRLFLERGTPLQVGELLRSSCGQHLRVEGAPEEVVTARCSDWSGFSRACYHLGNRHVKMQMGERWLRILPDHVLEALLERLGFTLMREQCIFIPESGAYGSSHHHPH